MDELINNILGTIIGGLLFTFILFYLNEYIFKKHNLTGEWLTTISIEESEYNPYKGLAVIYKLHLLQKEYALSGSGEKIKDINPDGTETIFEFKNRVKVKIDGYFERKYLGKSKIYLNISEEGRERESRATYTFEIMDSTNLRGHFISTAASKSGKVLMVK